MAIEIHDFEAGLVLKQIHIYYVLDTSASMAGIPIAALNDAMRCTIEELRRRDGERFNVHIAVLEYNSMNRRVTQGNNGVEHLRDFFWTDLEATGMTCLGGALNELSSILPRNETMRYGVCDVLNPPPIVIFTSDGCPVDDWQEGLRVLAENKWYRMATKIAFALGDQVDFDVLANVVGVTADGQIKPNHNAVIKISNPQELPDTLQIVSVDSCIAATSRAPLFEHNIFDLPGTPDFPSMCDTPIPIDVDLVDDFQDSVFDLI